MSSAHLHGRVISAHGRHFAVRADDGRLFSCVTRGKKNDVACGDRVEMRVSGDATGRIESISPRASLLYRSDAVRQKLLAANVTQLAIVVATEPSFSHELVTRALVAAEQQGIPALIVLNKCDLTARLASARQALAPFVRLGTPVLELSAKQDVGALAQRLRHQVTLLVGQSGMGKSTLVNALVPDADVATAEISAALDSGRHTTTHATWHVLDDDSALIDSPGFQLFGLAHVSIGELEAAFPEFRAHLGQCRFRDCHHEKEPGCALRAALQGGAIDPQRWAAYRAIRNEIAALPAY